ncbi:MAG: Gfo/Idh/MocA family oxidoreductase [Cytophagales bacterium]|nr:Gfo/Idh/MocA family oxidoreductase [Cytophagales bacterium]
MTTSRRKFCENSLKIAAGAGMISLAPAGASCTNLFNNKLVVGLIGCKGMGFSDLREFIALEEVEVKALCDVDKNVLEERAGNVEQLLVEKEKAGLKVAIKKPELYGDYRKLLEDKEIDAVIIGTPDHWHTLIAIDAMDAGKHIYVEKPLANTIHENLLVEKAAKKYNKVVQVGQWQRSDKHWQDAMNYVHSGVLGQIRLVKAWAYLNWFRVKPREDSPVPAGVDYDFWLGPARKRPFNPNRFHFHFRWFWDYAGGLMTDWGVHMLDFALEGMKAGRPKSVMSSGGMFAHPAGIMDTPDTQQTIYEFDKFNLLWEDAIGMEEGPYGRQHGVAFMGDWGTLVVDRSGWEVIPETKYKPKEKIIEAVPFTKGLEVGLKAHVKNFVACAKSRNKKTNAHAGIGAHVAIVGHMGNIAYRTGEKIYWDDEQKKFDHTEANELIAPTYRAPWTLPKI